MSPLFAFVALASLPVQAPIRAPVQASTLTPSPYVYRFAVGDRDAYAVRYAIKDGRDSGAVAETLTTEVLTVAPDGTATMRLSIADLKATGIARGQEFDTTDQTVTIDRYGAFSGFDDLTPQTKTLSLVFGLPNAELAERGWRTYPDAVTHGIPGLEIEGTIRARKGTQITFLARGKPSPDGQTFSRETTFDTERGRLVQAHVRGGTKGGPGVALDLERKEPKR